MKCEKCGKETSVLLVHSFTREGLDEFKEALIAFEAGDAERDGRCVVLPCKSERIKDAVRVVRCGECSHYNISGCSEGFGWCEKIDIGVTDGHFCSFGERRKP
jgi:hypothetical protein